MLVYLLTGMLVMQAEVRAVTAWTLTSDVDHVHLTDRRDTATLMCHADVPLIGCQYRVLETTSNVTYPALDLTSPGPGRLNVTDYTAAYHGTGLGDGHCGLRMTNVRTGLYTVVCRARGEVGGWQQAVVTVYAQLGGVGYFATTSENRYTTVRAGQSATITCQAAKNLDLCVFYFSSARRGTVFFGPQRRSEQDGRGLQEGVCETTMHDVDAEDGGPVWCLTRSEDRSYSAAATILVLADPESSQPELLLAAGTFYSVGDNVTATCNVQQSLPAANITWLLGDNVIRDDSDGQDDDDGTWHWPWHVQIVTQNVTVLLEEEDDEKEIVCRVNYPHGSKQSQETLTVEMESSVENDDD